MRFFGASVLAAALALLLFNSSFLEAAVDPSITGRLIFENGNFVCDQRCVVTLLASGVRPVQSVLPDLGGHFTFNNVPRGSYTIRIEVEGFETVTQPLDPFDNSEMNVVVPLVKKAAVSSTDTNVVNISEFLERYPKKAISLFEKGNESLKKKNSDEAVKYLRNAVELAPTFYEAHNQLGIAYREAGRLEDAEREFLKAHELNATNLDPLLNLTTLYIDENEPDRAVTTGEQAIKANSSSASAFFSLGIALYKVAQLDRAEAVLKRALDLAPKMANVRLMLANVYLKLRRYDNTLEQLNSYIAENPHGQQLQAAQQMRDHLLQARQTERP